MNEYSDLEGKVVLITGGANGIGAALVRAFQAQGSLVCFCDVDAVAGRELAKGLGAGVRFSKVDLLREKQVNKWVDAVAAEFGALHVLINNAACDPRIPVGETTVSDWDTLLARNLRSCFLTARAAEPFLKRGAAIINFSSITFHIAPADMSAYVASKGGEQGWHHRVHAILGPGTGAPWHPGEHDFSRLGGDRAAAAGICHREGEAHAARGTMHARTATTRRDRPGRPLPRERSQQRHHRSGVAG